MTLSIFTDLSICFQTNLPRRINMDAQSASLIGAGLAAIGAGMAAIGVGNVFGSFLESALRNPAAADGQQGRLFIGFAAAELLGLLSFLIAILLYLKAG
jgi:F-type H+-transporting ATPase subunit c